MRLLAVAEPEKDLAEMPGRNSGGRQPPGFLKVGERLFVPAQAEQDITIAVEDLGLLGCQKKGLRNRFIGGSRLVQLLGQREPIGIQGIGIRGGCFQDRLQLRHGGVNPVLSEQTHGVLIPQRIGLWPKHNAATVYGIERLDITFIAAQKAVELDFGL